VLSQLIHSFEHETEEPFAQAVELARHMREDLIRQQTDIDEEPL
jgi:hypothetical protein